MRTIGALVLLGFIVVAVVSLVQSFALTIPPGLTLTVIQGFLGAVVMATVLILVAFRAALVPERRFTSWVRGVVGPNGRYLFGLAILGWTAFMFLLGNLPPEPSGIPSELLGGLALIGMFAGAFVFLGFVWSVISE